MFLVFCIWMAFVTQTIITTAHVYLMKYLQQLPIRLPYGFRHAIRGNYLDYFYLIKSTFILFISQVCTYWKNVQRVFRINVKNVLIILAAFQRDALI